MAIFVVGINHKTAPIEVREKMYFPVENLTLHLRDILRRGHATEAVLLSTCNRSELYCSTDDIKSVTNWFCDQTTLKKELIEPSLYIYENEKAVQHIMEVAAGLDSMVLGEPQILGQMKQAFAESCEAEAVGTLFHRLFQQVFAISKDIRTTTSIGACPVSVASAAAHFAKSQVADFANANIVLVGAGDTTELMMRYLKNHLSKPLTLVNRSLDKASSLVAEFGATVYGLERMAAAIARADIVFSATGSPVPVVTQAIVKEAMQARQHKPLLIIDIAVPRDVEPAVANIDHVHLYCIDDLMAIIAKNMQGREHAVEKIRDMIQTKSAAFVSEIAALDKVTRTIRAYRSQIEDIRDAELVKARHQLQSGVSADEVLDAFAYAFSKKLMHAPSVQLRQAGAEGRFEILRFAKQLFAIPDPEAERT